MHDTEIVGWVYVPDGAICNDCKISLHPKEQDELSPIFAGSIDEWLNARDRSLVCVWDQKEIWEPDTEYAEKYAILSEKILGWFDPASKRYWCVDCQEVKSETSIVLKLNEELVELSTKNRLVCSSCEFWLLERAHHLAKRFKYDWGNVENVLDPWIKQGLLERDPTELWEDEEEEHE